MRALILIEDLVDEREFMYPYFRFKEAGFEVHVAGPRKGSYQGKRGFRGYPLEADMTFDEALKHEFDIIFIPGGYAPDRLRTYDSVLKLVRKAKNIAAICHGPWVLISAGLIKPDAPVAAYKSLKDDITNAGGKFVEGVAEYEIDGKRIFTATGPLQLPELMKKIIHSITD